MENIIAKVVDGVLTLTIDLSQPGSLSKSEKNIVIATTRGSSKIPGTEFTLGLNLYKKA